MPADPSAPPVVLRIENPKSATHQQNQAWSEVASKVGSVKVSKGTPASPYSPSFTEESACSPKNFPDRPQQISQCRQGGLVFFPGTTPIGTDFMIIDPLLVEGNTHVGDIHVDINHYYIVLRECDVVVQPGGKLVALAMSDIK
ncbi:hypothetical protein BDQ94DRAFT_164585 [Aspergillus welwitschiae]|uniref:Uncharacterized protein n=1 Tax=Aspergillus welwitschiae TaxID=1341132 RepID=A0A3F3PHI6_9EURO|nr:hypothetical protein BDQ94DRAFT_164585 [Aspergillus welwitschiae]RDH26317.1 hypothetical protein BDQ94DRAFT_164585 [Aspergillus welwitschiae]